MIFLILFATCFCMDFLRSALARRPVCTLRVHTLLVFTLRACKRRANAHTLGGTPPPKKTPPGTSTPTPPPRDPPTPTPSPPLLRNEGYSEWVVYSMEEHPQMCTKALCMAFAGTLISSALNIHALWKWVEKTPTSPASFLGWRVYMWGGFLPAPPCSPGARPPAGAPES
jgi:hypothetical protein